MKGEEESNDELDDNSPAKNFKASKTSQEDDDQPIETKVPEMFLLPGLVKESHLKRHEEKPLVWETLLYNW